MKSLTVGLSLVAATASAEEGMWRQSQLPSLKAELKKAGLALAPEKLADLSHGPLAAVINLGGCTASFISPDGLIATNHHCAVAALQANSTAEVNRLEGGFTAKTRADELWAGASSRVRVTLAETDITAELIAAAAGAKDDLAAYLAVDALGKKKVAECEKTPGMRCSVAKYDGGAAYALIEQLDLEDVRLVQAPPRAVGDYGGDIDNWMWPRHSGDWALFRAYVAPDGKPAPHADVNVPYRPKVWLPVNPDGVSPGGFVAVIGYPGRTYRHRTALELRQFADEDYPRQLALLDAFVEAVHAAQKIDKSAAVKLASLEAGLTNFQKYVQGNLDGFAGSGLVAARGKEEEALRVWAATSAAPKDSLKVLDAIDAADRDIVASHPASDILKWLIRGPALVRTAAAIHWLAVQHALPDADRDMGYQERDEGELTSQLTQIMQSFHPGADQAVAAFMLGRAAALPDASRLSTVDDFLKRFAKEGDVTAVLGHGIRQGAVDRAAAWLYESPRFDDADRRAGLMKQPRAGLEAEPDHALQFASLLAPDREADRDRGRAYEGGMARLRPAYMAIVSAFRRRPLYHDANSTLRVTFGRVEGMSPKDGLLYAPQTTLAGIVKKNTGKEPFDAPKALLDAIAVFQTKAHASGEPFVDGKLGSVPVDFLSTVDTTGGNSGSPTIDSRGRFVGLLFDGNYESMDSDWIYDRSRTRSIHCDVRYMLWSLVHVWDGAHLVREMGVPVR